jgi:enoyl-CoA hydratase/carnithine racemase
MAFTGEMISADEALACGLVSRVVADADLLADARALALRIAANPPQAVQQAKRLMLQARQSTLPAALESAAAVQALMHTTDAHREALEAFSKPRQK